MAFITSLVVGRGRILADTGKYHVCVTIRRRSGIPGRAHCAGSNNDVLMSNVVFRITR